LSQEGLGFEQGSEGSETGGRNPWRTPEVEGGSVESVPDSVREAARRAFDARPRDALVADLTFDSLLDGDRRATADPDQRTLRFGDSDAGADVTVTTAADGERVTVCVQVLPPQACKVEIRSSQAPTTTASTDETGLLEYTLPAGLMSMVIRPVRAPEPRPLHTAWVRV